MCAHVQATWALCKPHTSRVPPARRHIRDKKRRQPQHQTGAVTSHDTALRDVTGEPAAVAQRSDIANSNASLDGPDEAGHDYCAVMPQPSPQSPVKLLHITFTTPESELASDLELGSGEDIIIPETPPDYVWRH